MAKLTTPFTLSLPQKRPGTPAYRWLYSSLRSEILAGRLRPGARLPSTRDLSRQYGLARGTIIKAFEQLRTEGYVDGAIGSGTFVSRVLPEGLLEVEAGRRKIPQSRERAFAPSQYGKRVELFPGYGNRPMRAFRANLPALDLFPMELWTKLTVRCLRRMSTRHLMGCDPLGFAPLRQAITDYLTRSRGVRCAPEQVVITTGVQEAIDMSARLLLNPGDRVCVENPGYPGAVMVFQAIGASVITVPVDDEGLAIDHLPQRDVRLLYITPGHQFPLGSTMSLPRRLALLEWSRRSGAVILEDDYDSEYRYSGPPIPALQGLDTTGTVLYAGSFSKVLFPALRLGYIVIPAGLVPKFEAMQSLTLRHAPMIEQLVLTEFLVEGHFGRHLRRMRQVYTERLGVLLEEADAKLGGLLDVSQIEAGLQTAGWLRGGITALRAAAAAAKHNVDVTAIDSYNVGRSTRNGLQIGFAALEPREIRRGVRDLAIALEGERRRKQ
jgi:GntR family transcriptional regulator/MocR family aminotransferase